MRVLQQLGFIYHASLVAIKMELLQLLLIGSFFALLVSHASLGKGMAGTELGTLTRLMQFNLTILYNNDQYESKVNNRIR